jgi:hypothetical protein
LLVAELGELVGVEKGLRRSREIEREELGERHRHPVEHLLQRADRGTHAVLLDERNQAVRDSGTACKCPLRKAKTDPHAAQARTDVNAHTVQYPQRNGYEVALDGQFRLISLSSRLVPTVSKPLPES